MNVFSLLSMKPIINVQLLINKSLTIERYFCVFYRPVKGITKKKGCMKISTIMFFVCFRAMMTRSEILASTKLLK